MKYFAFFTFLIFAAYGLGFIKKPSSFEWMDRNYTTAIKGFAILTVVWAHSVANLGVGGVQFVAGVGVALFLICSGYGLEISYSKSGLRHFWSKRFLKVCIPFWIAALVGQIALGQFTVKNYVLTAVFVRSGWYLQYIAICYVLFFLTKVAVSKLSLNKSREVAVIIAVFAIWFAVDSLFFANPDMPFLRARQMLSFPCGMLIAKYKSNIEDRIAKGKCLLKIFIPCIIGLGMMLVTNLEPIKKLPFIISNILSLFTVLPLAIAVLAVFWKLPFIFENHFLLITGQLSYEIYLIHTYALAILGKSLLRIIVFLVVTYLSAVILHLLVRRRGNDGFNGYNSHKK